MDQKQGAFVAIEGLDGAGTTTQAALLFSRAERERGLIWSTSEPTKSPIGELLRSVLAGTHRVTPGTVAHLFAADRHEHLYGGEGILARRSRGELVICDRYKYSSLAYQSIDADRELVRSLNDPFPNPDVLIYVDLPPEVGEQRLSGRSSREIYEHLEFQRAVSANYQREIERARQTTRVVVVDGTLNEQIIAGKLYAALTEASIL